MDSILSKSKLIIFCSLLLVSILSIAQDTGTIEGVLSDKLTEETLIGAQVKLLPIGKSVSTDFDGNFKFTGLAPGTYSLVGTFVGYNNDTLRNIVVNAGETTTASFSIGEDVLVIEGATVVVKRLSNTETAVIQEIKNAEEIVSGVSSEQISKSQDRDAAQVMRRIPGITLIEDRFIIVRGLSSRYNTVLLNGAISPSTEAESRAFSFDIVPSSLLDRLLVFKSGSADLPGEFAGAVVKLYTKNAVDKNFTDFNFTMGHRVGTTFGDFKRGVKGKYDFLTFDDGTRRLPEGTPDDFKDLGFQYDEILAQSKKFENNFRLTDGRALPDMRFRFNMGRAFKIGNVKVSSINSLSYSNTNQFRTIERFRYTNYDENRESVSFFRFSDDQYSNNVRIGALSNWSFQLNKNHKIDFRNLYTRMGNTETVFRTGFDDDKGQELQNYSMRFRVRSVFSSQLQGTHDFRDDKSRFTWVMGYSNSMRDEPDWLRVGYRRNQGTDNPFQILIPQNANANDASRFYQNLNENVVMHRGDYEHKIDFAEMKLKAGYYLEQKDRSFAARTIGYIKFGSQFDNDIIQQPLESIFGQENIRIPDGMVISENTKYTDRYTASNTLLAGYVGTTFKLKEKTNISTGVRAENNRQYLETGISPSGLPDIVDNPVLSILPFANVSYNFSDKMLTRIAYSKTINRPEFREIAPFSFYDFNFEVDIIGNTSLQVADIHNIDLRWEMYPTAGEFIAFGAFYKKFFNPIETIIRTGANNPVLQFSNAESANTIGAEVEIRKSLSGLTNSAFVDNLSVLFNGALIKSVIDLGDNYLLTESRTRPMQGQSPYLINFGLYHQDTERKMQVSLIYNIYGRRIFSVGDQEFPTIWEMPRNFLDLTVSKDLSEKLTFKFGIQNILNAKLIYREDGNLDGKVNNTTTDKLILRTQDGQYITAGITLKL